MEEKVLCNICNLDNTKLLFIMLPEYLAACCGDEWLYHISGADILTYRTCPDTSQLCCGVRFIKDEVPVVRCKHCGLVYVNPRSKPKNLHKQYHESSYFDYYAEMGKSDWQTFRSRLTKTESLGRVFYGELIAAMRSASGLGN